MKHASFQFFSGLWGFSEFSFSEFCVKFFLQVFVPLDQLLNSADQLVFVQVLLAVLNGIFLKYTSFFAICRFTWLYILLKIRDSGHAFALNILFHPTVLQNLNQTGPFPVVIAQHPSNQIPRAGADRLLEQRPIFEDSVTVFKRNLTLQHIEK